MESSWKRKFTLVQPIRYLDNCYWLVVQLTYIPQNDNHMQVHQFEPGFITHKPACIHYMITYGPHDKTVAFSKNLHCKSRKAKKTAQWSQQRLQGPRKNVIIVLKNYMSYLFVISEWKTNARKSTHNDIPISSVLSCEPNIEFFNSRIITDKLTSLWGNLPSHF